MSDWIAIALSTACSLIAGAASYGSLKSNQTQLEKEIDRISGEMKDFMVNYVTQKHFDSVVQLLQTSQSEMQRDIKEILQILAKR